MYFVKISSPWRPYSIRITHKDSFALCIWVLLQEEKRGDTAQASTQGFCLAGEPPQVLGQPSSCLLPSQRSSPSPQDEGLGSHCGP